MSRPLYITIPAFGAHYVNIAVRYTIPALRQAINERKGGEPPTFLVYSNDRQPFEEACQGYSVKGFSLDFASDQHPFPVFIQCHKHAMEYVPGNALLALFNADIVTSKECFAAADRALTGQKRVIMSAGVRAVDDQDHVPIGATADHLAEWIWNNRHPITSANIWAAGCSRLPTMIYFDDGYHVAMHGFHLTPMFIVKDRPLTFTGTIDDDVVESYQPEEIVYLTGRQASFAELSPRGKKHGVGASLMNVKTVVDFGLGKLRPCHVENFRHRFSIKGTPQRDHPAVKEILIGLGHKPSLENSIVTIEPWTDE